MSSFAWRLLLVALGLLAAFAGLCRLLFFNQRNLIYFPWRWSEEEERRANPGYEEVRFRSADGEALHGWLRRSPEAPWTVVVFHGNGGNLSVQADLMDPFVNAGLQVLLFDYRGYGLSTGRPTEQGLIEDGEAAAQFVMTELRVPPERTVYFGKSLGTGVAVLVAAARPPDRQPARLVLESSFDSMAEVGAHHYPFLPVRWFLRDRYDAASVIGRVRCPILFIHGGADEIVPIERGRALFERANPGRDIFVVIPGARHNDPPSSYPPLYLDAIGRFLGLRREGSERGQRPGS